MTPEFHSQCGEDRWLWEHAEELGLPMRGVYVDVGASDGIDLSNTKWLEDLGWRGLCIEPHPESFVKLGNNRRCKTAAVAIGHRGIYRAAAIPDHSGVMRSDGDAIDVSWRSLQDMTREHAMYPIDIMSIDTEGSELDVWSGRDRMWPPRILVIEHDTIDLPPAAAAVTAQVVSDGYRLLYETKYNLIFKRN